MQLSSVTIFANTIYTLTYIGYNCALKEHCITTWRNSRRQEAECSVSDGQQQQQHQREWSTVGWMNVRMLSRCGSNNAISCWRLSDWRLCIRLQRRLHAPALLSSKLQLDYQPMLRLLLLFSVSSSALAASSDSAASIALACFILSPAAQYISNIHRLLRQFYTSQAYDGLMEAL